MTSKTLFTGRKLEACSILKLRLGGYVALFFAVNRSQSTKLGIIVGNFGRLNSAMVCSLSQFETVVTPSHLTIAYRQIFLKSFCDPTRVTSVPCSVATILTFFLCSH